MSDITHTTQTKVIVDGLLSISICKTIRKDDEDRVVIYFTNQEGDNVFEVLAVANNIEVTL